MSHTCEKGVTLGRKGNIGINGLPLEKTRVTLGRKVTLGKKMS